jgi:hypothetical protein
MKEMKNRNKTKKKIKKVKKEGNDFRLWCLVRSLD